MQSVWAAFYRVAPKNLLVSFWCCKKIQFYQVFHAGLKLRNKILGQYFKKKFDDSIFENKKSNWKFVNANSKLKN